MCLEKSPKRRDSEIAKVVLWRVIWLFPERGSTMAYAQVSQPKTCAVRVGATFHFTFSPSGPLCPGAEWREGAVGWGEVELDFVGTGAQDSGHSQASVCGSARSLPGQGRGLTCYLKPMTNSSLGDALSSQARGRGGPLSAPVFINGVPCSLCSFSGAGPSSLELWDFRRAPPQPAPA